MATAGPESQGEPLATSAPDEALQALSPRQQQWLGWREPAPASIEDEIIADDVNSLSLALDSDSSYIGISSTNTALRVISHIDPTFRNRIPRNHDTKPMPTSPAASWAISDMSTIDESTFVDAYFAEIHTITPMIDEDYFRVKILRDEEDQSPSWLALRNMVLVMGSLATRRGESCHMAFFARASPHLTFSCFGMGSLEVVQALALYGGYYCHFLNRPNIASTIMGAALRLALAMGLHLIWRSSDDEQLSHERLRIRETGRRTWWCLHCLDSWASLPLGRPSPGLWDTNTILTSLPESRSLDVNNPALNVKDEAQLKENHLCSSLVASIEFCRIATTIQDRFARHPPISCSEIEAFHHKLLGWRSRLPFPLNSTAHIPRIHSALDLMEMRYQNSRLLLYRPRLLIAALLRRPVEKLPPDEERAVRSCRSIAHEIIAHTSSDKFYSSFTIRNATWYLFQACLVPLIGLFSDGDSVDTEIWKQDVESVIRTLSLHTGTSSTVNRTLEVIASLYAASSTDSRTHSSPDTNLYVPQDLWNDDSLFEFFRMDWDYDFENQYMWDSESGFGIAIQ